MPTLVNTEMYYALLEAGASEAKASAAAETIARLQVSSRTAKDPVLWMIVYYSSLAFVFGVVAGVGLAHLLR